MKNKEPRGSVVRKGVEVTMHSFGYTTGNAFQHVQWVLITVIIRKASSIHCLQVFYAIILQTAVVSVLVAEVGDHVPADCRVIM
jgi:fatty acid desaturase